MWTEHAQKIAQRALHAALDGGTLELHDASGKVLASHALQTPAMDGKGNLRQPEPDPETVGGTPTHAVFRAKTGQILARGRVSRTPGPDVLVRMDDPEIAAGGFAEVK